MAAKEQPRKRCSNPWANVAEARIKIIQVNKGAATKQNLAVHSLLHNRGHWFPLLGEASQ